MSGFFTLVSIHSKNAKRQNESEMNCRSEKEERRKKKRNNDYDLYTIWYGNELNFQYLANFDYYDRNGVVTAAVAAAACC